MVNRAFRREQAGLSCWLWLCLLQSDIMCKCCSLIHASARHISSHGHGRRSEHSVMALVCLHCRNKAVDIGDHVGGTGCTRAGWHRTVCTSSEEVFFCKYGCIPHSKHKKYTCCNNCVASSSAAEMGLLLGWD